MVKVITYGTFDLFHEGHYNILRRAKELGDYLIVGVTSEEYDQARGKLNVVDSLITRIENVKKTGFADEIVVEESQGQKFRDIQKYNIDIFTVGSDWTGVFDYLKDYCQVVYLDRTKDISSTMLRIKETPIQRIGIIGTGRIANRFVPEAALVSGVNAQCVYNPRFESAEAFARKWGIDACKDMEDFFLEEPMYSEPDQSVKLVLKNNIVMRTMRQSDRTIENIGNDIWDKLDDLERKILVYMGSRATVTRAELEQHISRSGRTVGARLNHLMELGLVKRNGNMYDPKQTYEMVE